MKIKGYYKGKLIKEVDDISELYDEGYFHGDVYTNYTLKFVKPFYEKRMNLVKQFWKGNGKILDVGCALGFFLLRAKNQGSNPMELYFSKYAIHEAKKIFGDSVVCCDVEKHIPFRDEFFDIITCWDVIEHLKNPRLVLERLARKLKDCGLLLIETCNYESISRKLMKENWDYFGDGYHQTPQITIGILRNWLENASFKILTIYTEYTHVPLRDLLISSYHSTNEATTRYLWPIEAFEAILGKFLKRVNPSIGDLIYCVARKSVSLFVHG